MPKKETRAKKLRLGPERGYEVSEALLRERITVLKLTLEKYIPAFVKAVCTAAAAGDTEIITHQDAFAADYDHDEYVLFGMALKYAGINGITVVVSPEGEDANEEKDSQS